MCFLIDLVTLQGNLSMPSVSVKGKPVDLTSEKTKKDLKNSSSTLYVDLVDLIKPEVFMSFSTTVNLPARRRYIFC